MVTGEERQNFTHKNKRESTFCQSNINSDDDVCNGFLIFSILYQTKDVAQHNTGHSST